MSRMRHEASAVCEKKADASGKERAGNKLADWDFTCGAQLQDLNFEGRLLDVHTRHISCKDPIEKLCKERAYLHLVCSTPAIHRH